MLRRVREESRGKMERKLIAFDLDGTLLDDRKQPLPSTVVALDQLRKVGHEVTIATGRNRRLAKPIIDQLSFENAVLCNGSVAFANHQMFYERTLNEDAFNRCSADLIARNIDVAVIGLDDTKRITTFHEHQMSEAMKSFGSFVPPFDAKFYQTNSIYQGLAFYDSQEPFDSSLYDAFDFVRWHPECVDIIPKNGSKAITLLKLANQLGIARENVIAFGDGMNDREMLKEVGVGIAMGNAAEEVKRQADMVTASNEQDGILKALVKLNLCPPL